MEVVINTTADEAGRLAADAIEELLGRRPDAVLGVATGSSPLIIYEELGHRVAQGSLSLASAQAFMLDEYVGLAADHPQRYRNVIQADFVARFSARPSGPQTRAGSISTLSTKSAWMTLRYRCG